MNEIDCKSSEHYHNGRCCKRCPKGQFVVEDCSEGSAETTCAPCGSDYYISNENYLYSCFQCTICDHHSNMMVLKRCQADSDTQCTCKEGYYFRNDHCAEVTKCLQGTGVLKPPTYNLDTTCTKCPEGTFSNVTDYKSPCLQHTNCEKLGRRVLEPGTDTTDAVCGGCISEWHSIVPASLWVGFILSVVLFFGFRYCRSKRRRKTVIISLTSEKNHLPVLPPDIIKCPKEPVLHTDTLNDILCPEEDLEQFETDGVEIKMIPKSFNISSMQNLYPSFIPASSVFKSEPEEDEWFGV